MSSKKKVEIVVHWDSLTKLELGMLAKCKLSV